MLEALISTLTSATAWIDDDQTIAPILFWLGIVIVFLTAVVVDNILAGMERKKRDRKLLRRSWHSGIEL